MNSVKQPAAYASCHAWGRSVNIWSRSERPADFARMFTIERNHKSLMDCLALRIDETLRGLGDVPSGDVNDMEPLTRYEFDLRF